MVGLIAPFLAALPAVLAAGGPTCDPMGQGGAGNDSCQPSQPVMLVLLGPSDPDDEPRYATQAVIDCPVPALGSPWAGLAGECDATLSDASYRASRDPDSERVPSSLRPARRDRNGAGKLAACAGTPSEGGDATSAPAPSQPLALYALPALPPVAAARFSLERSTWSPTRSPRPLERPPRT